MRECSVCGAELKSSDVDTSMSNEFEAYCWLCGQHAYYASMERKSAMWAAEEQFAYNYGLDD